MKGYQEGNSLTTNEKLLSVSIEDEQILSVRPRMWRGIALLTVLVLALVTLVGTSILSGTDNQELAATGIITDIGDDRAWNNPNEDDLDPSIVGGQKPGEEEICDAKLRHFAEPLKEYEGLNSTLCGDGEEYGFYYRASPTGSKKWLVVVMGMDLYCESVEACEGIYENHHHRLAAKTDECWNGAGVFDAKETGQPFHDWNMFYLPYCTQDNWLGTGNEEAAAAGFVHDGYYLMMNFLNEMDTNTDYDIEDATQMVFWWVENQVYMWGNYIGDRLTEDYPNLDLRFVSDDGWYPELHTQWNDTNGDLHADRLAIGWDYWGTVEVSEWCKENGLTWECLFPENSYTGFRYPIINTLNMYNRVLFFNQGEPLQGFFDGNYEVESKEHAEYLQWVMSRIMEHLELTSCFVPACNGHTFAYVPTLMEFQVATPDGPIYLVDLLTDWLSGPAWDLPEPYIDNWEGRNWLVESDYCEDAI